MVRAETMSGVIFGLQKINLTPANQPHHEPYMFLNL